MSRAFTLLELMVVIAIAGIIATLAVPSFQSMAQHYRGLEASRAALAAVSEGRALAQRSNEPVQVRLEAKRVVLSKAIYAESADVVRKNVTSFEEVRVVALPSDVKVTKLEYLTGTGAVGSSVLAGADATFIFCASSDSYFRFKTSGAPVCGIGNLASSMARIVLKGVDGDHNIRVNAALGSLDIKSGAL